MLFSLLSVLLFSGILCETLFKSLPVTVKTYENETVLLPCYVDDSESQIRVRWYKDERLLGDSKDAHHFLPPRVIMHANYSLQFDGVTAKDTANYTCEVIHPEPRAPMKQTHRIQVLFPPSISTIPEDGYLEVRKGEYVDIGCEVSGVPDPVVDWKKNGESMALLDHRSRIRFRAEHWMLSGVYECLVNNGVGDSVQGSIRVVIQDAPVVSAVSSHVHSSAGLRAALAASVQFAAPPAHTLWLRADRHLHYDDRVVQMVQGNLHQLIFRSVRESDFGNYTFRAENKYGMADVTFKLTGVPNAASFKVEQSLNKATATSFTLIWEVDSYSAVLEYNLWLRPYVRRNEDHDTSDHTNRWSKIVVPGDVADGPIHSARYTVRGLTPTTVYEAIVTSRNKYGWSQKSAILHFATEPLGGRSLPASTDYSDIAPLLEELPPEQENITHAQTFNQQSASSARENRISAMFVFGFMVLARFS